jgi:hypothetical protein
MPDAGAVVVADGDVPAPPSEANAEGPTIAAATARPVTAPMIGARHLLAGDDMCFLRSRPGGADRRPVRRASEPQLKSR